MFNGRWVNKFAPRKEINECCLLDKNLVDGFMLDPGLIWFETFIKQYRIQ